MKKTLAEFLIQNKYISINEYTKFCEENNIIPDFEYLDQINEQFIKRKLIEEKDFFDNIFTSVGENILLDEEQRKIILKDDDYCLINAGAGSGKSTTMAGKVKYLVEKLHVKPEEIIMLSFTKKSSEDLDEKVNTLLNLGIPVSTFHSLGMNFIRKLYPFPVNIAGEDEQKRIIKEYISSLFNDKKKLLKFIQLFKSNGKIARGFVYNAPKFDNFEDYFNNYKKRKYERESKNKGGIHQYIINRLNSEKILYSIKGEKCKSISEVKIANFLYINGIDYEYERTFEERVDEDRAYLPDFTIEHAGKKIYVEYFGLSSFYDNNNVLNQKIELKYNRIRKQKEHFQATHNYDFINLDYINPDGMFIDTLRNELISRNVAFNKKSDDEIFYAMLDQNVHSEFFKLENLFVKFIDILKNMLVDDVNYMFEKRKKGISIENFKTNYYSLEDNVEAKYRIEALDFFEELYNFYEEKLTENNMIDYNDMINLSYKHIIKNLKEKDSNLIYKYIIVDEYQDITFQRYLFVKRLVEYFNAKLISVGDDWQSIYSFNGSRLDLFNKFTELFANSKDDMILSTTYRFGQELVDISSKFILENKEQIYKKIKSPKHLKYPIEIHTYNYFDEYKTINDIIHQLYANNPNDNILLLARTNRCLYNLCNSKYFRSGINDTVICNELPNAKIEALTMHRSKGLTSDQVIVFGLRENTFPSKGRSEHWIFDYFKLDTINENFPYAEERRLFYVALTRTRNKVYLVTPNSSIFSSNFINEIKEDCIK